MHYEGDARPSKKIILSVARRNRLQRRAPRPNLDQAFCREYSDPDQLLRDNCADEWQS